MSPGWRKVILGEKEAPWPDLSDKHVKLGIQAHRTTIKVLNQQIEAIEATILKHLKPIREYRMLLTVPGIGPVLGWTIVFEAGDLRRFADVGHFASYCRCVDSKKISNEKKKGQNNRKNGNPYLSWAFFEAANRTKAGQRHLGSLGHLSARPSFLPSASRWR